MYRKYFGIRKAPFSISPDPRYLYMSEQHREALAHLFYGLRIDGGFVLLTGEVGTGKTTICRRLLQQLPKSCIVAFIINPRLSVLELLASICDEFGIDYPKETTSIKVLVDCINACLLDAHANRRKPILIIDEAQSLSYDVLEQIRLLTNLETDQRKLLQIILIGQPELRDRLEEPELRQLAQRIVARYHLGPLAGHETAPYVYHRLAVSGIKDELFTPGGLKRLHALSGGIPRLINTICDRALLGAYVQEKRQVDAPTLARAATEVLGSPVSRARRYGKGMAWLGAGMALALIAAALMYFGRPPIGFSWLETASIEQRETKSSPLTAPVPKPPEAMVPAVGPSAVER